MKTYTARTIPTIKEINAAKKKFVAASLFSGCGGASVGLRLAGFDVRYANEFVPVAAETYKANAPKTTIVSTKDVRKVKPEEVLKACRVKKGQLDYLDGSPPCSAFSTASLHKKEKNFGKEKLYSENIKQRVDDLFFEFTRLLKGIKPKVFVAENVTGLKKSINQGYLVEIYKELEACGYKVEVRVIDASRLGVPQKRERLIFIGIRNDLAKRGFKPIFPSPLETKITVKDVLPHIERIKLGGNSGKKCGRGYVDARQPSPTITASDALTTEMAQFSCGAYVETKEGERRKYTISELKKVFGFPKDFKLTGKYEQQFERLGRTHVPLQVYYLASTLREQVLDKL